MATFGNMKALWLWFQYWSGRSNQYQSGIARMDNGVFKTDCNGIIKMFGYAENNPANVPAPNASCPNYRGGVVADEYIGTWYNKATKKGLIDTIPKDGYYLVYIDNTTKHPGAWNHVGIYNGFTGETFEMCAVGIRKMPLDKTYWNKWSDLYWCPDEPEEVKDVEVVRNVRGYIDGATPSDICGWAYDGTDSALDVTIEVFLGETKKKTFTVKADKFRPDLVEHKIGNGYHAYTFDPDVESLPAGKYTVKAYVGNKELPSSNGPKEFELKAIRPGMQFMIREAPVFKTETVVTPYTTRTGYYFVWSDEVKNGRVRVTNSATRVGVAGQVSFWIETKYVK